MRPYLIDLSIRVLKDCDGGMPTEQVAEKYAVSPAWIDRSGRA
jgi:hypothetical protein